MPSNEKLAASRADMILNTVLAGGALFAGATIAGVIADKVKSMYSIYKSKEYFQKMLEAHPQLNDVPPDELAKYWSSLYHFAPHMAQDPLAAGAYITQSLRKLSGTEFGGPPPETFNTLVDVQKKFKEGRSEVPRSIVREQILRNIVNSSMAAE